MTSFIHDVLIDIKKKEADLSKLIFILPSKRAGFFLKNQLSQITSKTIISPEIISIEEFIQTVSQLKPINNISLLFDFYEVYLELTPKNEVETFDVFSKWAQIIIQDFNEIDRYLINPETLFNYLSAIKDVDHWSLQNEQTELVKKYLSFWKRLPQYYQLLNQKLIANQSGYQGLQYREAVDKLQLYIEYNKSQKHIFLGFNALNNAEQTLIQELLSVGLADIYWDIDKYFSEVPYHDAGLFVRRYKKWPYFSKNNFKWNLSHYKEKKDIHCIGIPKNVSQAKYAGELLQTIKVENPTLENTALILGDESLLTPVINSIPKGIDAINITMGMPLKNSPLASLFFNLFELHKTELQAEIYFKDVISIITHPFIRSVLDANNLNTVTEVQDYISKNNVSHISLDKLQDFFKEKTPLISLLFKNWNKDAKTALNSCKTIVQHIKVNLQENKEDNLLALEHLFRFNQIFNQLSLLLEDRNYISDSRILFGIYKELLSTETLDFHGEPLKGLQILGVLESRVIDFETIIITSVNEGVLPSGKSNNSFIPFDVKLQYDLPTYKEKDAIYTYHFYHLLQRAKTVYILYNTEIDALQGGEKSRFITQLEVDDAHDIKQYTVTPKVSPITQELKRIKKTEAILNTLKDLAHNGFSPSALTSYIRNPIDFYKQKILHLNTFEDVEETVASNTLGTILHNTLEDLYKPCLGQFLTENHIKEMHLKANKLVSHYFKEEYKEGNISTGKNLIIFEISKRYISNFLNKELEAIKKGDQIKIIALEKKLKIQLPIDEFDFPVYLKGTVDRIDECNGVLRVIDYKSGKVTQNKVEVVDWDDLNTDYDKYSKSFQILMYAYIMHLTSPFKSPIEAGIISFKNLQAGLLKFGQKEASNSRKKDTLVTQDVFDAFDKQLKLLILEICNPEADFIEKEV